MVASATLNFDEWNKIPEDKNELQATGDSIYWNQLNRMEFSEIGYDHLR